MIVARHYYESFTFSCFKLANHPELLAYVSYAKGFETPTFTEMAYPAQGGASTLI
jgi:outer membrane receptor protein involved in Fe transport